MRPLLLVPLALLACKPRHTCTAQEGPLPIQLLAAAGPDLNPCEDGRPCAANLRIYELKSGNGLDALDFDAVLERHDQAFGEALVKSHERYIFPGGRERWTLDLDPSTTHVVTVGLFREPLGDAWYQVFAVPSGHSEQACDAAARGKPIGDPCIYLAFDEYEISGGRFPPAGFDVQAFETACAPVARVQAKPRKQRRKPSLPSIPTVPTVPQVPTMPTAPSAPALPSAPSAPAPPRAPAGPSLTQASTLSQAFRSTP